MTRFLFAAALFAFTSLSWTLAAGAARAAGPDGPRRSEALGLRHPAEILRAAADLFRAGRRDEAVFWFYLGQLRYRVLLVAHPDAPKSGDPALFSSLMEVIGRPINEYAFGDVPALAKTLDEVLAFDDGNEDPWSGKAAFPAARRNVRDGLAAMRAEIVATADDIRARRRANGLGNRN